MNLIQISKEMRNDLPVFIVGHPRSGTTLLYRTLQKLAAFHPKQINAVETKLLAYSSLSFAFRDTKPPNMWNYMLMDRVQYDGFLKSIKKIQIMHRVLFLASLSKNLRLSRRFPWWWYINLNHIILRSFYYYAKEARGCHRLVEKTPENVAHVQKLFLAFPKCKLLYIYRHPIDVLTSYRRRGQIEETKAHWANFSPTDFCLTYKKSINLAVKHQKKAKDSLLLISYENFVQDTEIEFKNICRFLGEPFEKEAIIERNPDLTKWVSDPHLFGKIIPKTKNWREYISLEETQQVENALESTMNMLNYKKYSALDQD
jgi:hypothetical protein